MKVTYNTRAHTLTIESTYKRNSSIAEPMTLGEITDFLSHHYPDFKWRDLETTSKIYLNLPKQDEDNL